jgi:hypothetical protein
LKTRATTTVALLADGKSIKLQPIYGLQVYFKGNWLPVVVTDQTKEQRDWLQHKLAKLEMF